MTIRQCTLEEVLEGVVEAEWLIQIRRKTPD